jgi:hypothetical protein
VVVGARDGDDRALGGLDGRIGRERDAARAADEQVVDEELLLERDVAGRGCARSRSARAAVRGGRGRQGRAEHEENEGRDRTHRVLSLWSAIIFALLFGVAEPLEWLEWRQGRA